MLPVTFTTVSVDGVTTPSSRSSMSQELSTASDTVVDIASVAEEPEGDGAPDSVCVSVDESSESTAVGPHTSGLAMRVLELEDEVIELRRQLDDKLGELQSKEDELTCLSSSLLEKEKLLRGYVFIVCVYEHVTRQSDLRMCVLAL